MPVLYVFGRGSLDVADLASALLSGPLSVAPPDAVTATDIETAPSLSTAKPGGSGKAPVLLLYDVTYAHAIPALLDKLSGAVQEGRLVAGFPTPEAYSPLGASSSSSSAPASQGGGCECGATSTPSEGPHKQQQLLANGGSKAGTGCRKGSDPGPQGTGGCCSVDSKTSCGGGGGGDGSEVARQAQATSQAENLGETREAPAACGAGAGCNGREMEQPSTTAAPGVSTPPLASKDGEAQQEQQQQQPSEKRRVRIGGLGVELESEEDLQRHALVFVGREGRQLSNVLMRCAGCVDRVRYDPALPPGERVVGDTRKGNKDLMRRWAGFGGRVGGCEGGRCRCTREVKCPLSPLVEGRVTRLARDRGRMSSRQPLCTAATYVRSFRHQSA